MEWGSDPVFTQSRSCFSFKGNAIFINAKRLEALYEFHQTKKVEIVEALENKPWGMSSYIVRELNDYYLVFAGALIPDQKESSAAFPAPVRVIYRLPTVAEYQLLASTVEWTAFLEESVVKKLLAAPLFGIVAVDSERDETIGCALVLGEGASFYYIKDVIVHPEWQKKHVGAALMKELSHWLENNAANNALVALITPESLAPFCQGFGFSPAFSMIRHIHPNEK